jgi:hypothetical protein
MNFEKKERLYWLCQLGGWSLFTILELANYMMIDGFYPLLIVNGIVNIFLGIAITHLYRLFLIRSAWLNMPSYKLIPRVAIAVLIMSGVMAGINIPLDWITYPITRLLFSITCSIGVSIFYFGHLPITCFNIGSVPCKLKKRNTN